MNDHYISLGIERQPPMSHFVRTFKRRKLFLDQLEVGSSIAFAASAAGGTVANFKAWRSSDPNFAQDWDDALEAGTDFIEDVATERALTKSDPLMQMILKARRPDKYDRGSKLELSGNVNVEGSKAKLLNKIAKLQALGRKEAQGERKALEEAAQEEAEEGRVEEAQKTLALPAPAVAPTGRGHKRRAAIERSGRKKASTG
jgi:hypothetical protein